MTALAVKRGETLSVPGAPAGAVALMLGNGRSPARAVPVADGSAVVSASMTTDLEPGLWRTEWRVEVGGAVSLPAGPDIEVEASVTFTPGFYGPKPEPTWAQRALAAVEAALLTASGSGDVGINVDGLGLAFESRSDLLAYRAKLADEVAVERLAATG